MYDNKTTKGMFLWASTCRDDMRKHFQDFIFSSYEMKESKLTT